MKDFHFFAPTEVCFGLQAEDSLVEMIKKYGGTEPKVLVHFGGGSAVRSGLIPRTEKALGEAGIEYVELGGVQPNPRLSLVHEGVKLCRQEGVTLILAVGGGSVIDSAKAIGYGTLYEGDEWDFHCGRAQAKATLPVGCILTLPAAGSEMSDCSVISNDETQQKFGYSNDIGRLKFAIMNPVLTLTLPDFQTACGAVDIMMHTMERYFTKDTDMDLHTAMSEALLRTVKEAADALLCNKEKPASNERPVLGVSVAESSSLRHRSTLMWAGSWAHNDFTGTRNMADFATHKMEHELSALFDVAHGAGLSALWPSWARYVMNENPARFASFAVNVMGVVPDKTEEQTTKTVEETAKTVEETALRGIEAMEDCYRRWKMPTNIPELLGRPATEEEILLMADKCTRGDTFHPGYFKSLSREDVETIYRLANKYRSENEY